MTFDGALAVLLAAKYCKQYPLFQWREEALPAIGQRRDKFSFRVDLGNLQKDRCGEMLMTLFPSSLSFLDFHKDKDALYKLKALLVTLKHPYILPVIEIYYSKEKRGLLVVQPFSEHGSIRDRIHRTRPALAFEDKYRLDRAAPLPLDQIAKLGRQVLEALSALRSKGIICDQLSAGNVVVDDLGNARIAEIYTPLLAIDRHRHVRELTVPLEAKVDVDVVLFGHLLYEMATGMELPTAQPEDSVLELMAPEIADVLDLIFYPMKKETLVNNQSTAGDDDTESILSEGSSSVRGEAYLISIEQLLSCALFVNADVPPIESLFSGFRLDSSMKSTVRHSMRINASRNHAYVVQYKEKMALQRARQRAERRVYDEKDKQDKRAQHQLVTSRGLPTAGGSDKPLSRRKSYRANNFKSPVQRKASSSTAAPTTTATA